MSEITNWPALEVFFAQGCAEYQQSAPTVARHLDEIYRLVQGMPSGVSWQEMTLLFRLNELGIGWLPANLAANYVYKLRHQFGRDTTGYAGF